MSLQSTQTYDGRYILFADGLEWKEVDMIHKILSDPYTTQICIEIVESMTKPGTDYTRSSIELGDEVLKAECDHKYGRFSKIDKGA